MLDEHERYTIFKYSDDTLNENNRTEQNKNDKVENLCEIQTIRQNIEYIICIGDNTNQICKYETCETHTQTLL